jgi:hypothetical protein
MHSIDISQEVKKLCKFMHQVQQACILFNSRALRERRGGSSFLDGVSDAAIPGNMVP